MKTLDGVIKTFTNLRELREELYIHEPCGGPLHIITDDGNIDGDHLVFCYRYLHEGDYTAYIMSICKSILHELMLLEKAQRVVWWLEGAITELGRDPTQLAFQARDCHVEWRENGCYDALLVNNRGVVWEGLEQVRERKNTGVKE